jgi:TPR repeat protein
MAGAAAEAEELRRTIERAAQGDAAAQTNLANRYEDGDGVVQDQAEALRLHAQAAARGDALAQYSYGRCYMMGIGVDHDEVKGAPANNL